MFHLRGKADVMEQKPSGKNLKPTYFPWCISNFLMMEKIEESQDCSKIQLMDHPKYFSF